MRNHGLSSFRYLQKGKNMKFDKKIAKLAAADAYDWGVAGLLVDDIAWKNERISGYGEAFNKALNTQDISAEVKFLADARRALEKKGFTGEVASKKGRNIKIALLVAGGLYVAYEMGLFETAKQKQRKAKLFLATIQDKDSPEYKDLVDRGAKKIAAWVDAPVESKYEKPMPKPGEELPPEAGGDAGDYWPPNNT